MIPSAASQVLALADSNGWQTCAEKTREERGEDGQFFTPPVIARSLAEWFQPESFNRPSLHLLDPGAGGGVLTAALVERIIALRANGVLPELKEITLEVWELDEAFLPALRENLAACSEALRQAKIRTTLQLHHGSYIEGAARALDSGLFETSSAPKVTHAILNPPYRKIATRSRERALLATVGIENSNLYSAFVSLALRQLADGGELAAITPRSFCNGPYFREFRRELMRSANFHRVHVFDSRAEAFGRDQVLQENILFHLSRGKPGKAALTVSTGSLEAPVKSRVSRERFVSPSDPDQVIHIATESDATDIRSFFEALPCLLPDLDIQVSTGPVVDFRLKEFLADHISPGSVPLIYPHCVKSGQVLAPLSHASEYGDARMSKKPVAIREDGEARKWLLQSARFVLIKRFSSKEEKRRLVAGVLDPTDFPSGLVGIENHLNFFHRKRSGLSAPLARGLSRFLNSTVADRYFRQFNGHTQVNASDLRSFRYPNIKDLERLGKASLDDTEQSAIDLAMTEHLGAPSGTGSVLGFQDFDLHRSNSGTPTNSKIDTKRKSCSRELMKNPSELRKTLSGLTCIEICSGAGGQAIGLERAGFEALAHVEYDRHACATLRLNRPNWNVVEGDVRGFSAKEFKGVDLLAGGVPCPPFSKAGKQLGSEDERDLFPEALRLVDECRPKAVMLENVRGFLDAVFTDYRMTLKKEFKAMGYEASWHLLNASDFGVPQLRPRVVIVAIRKDLASNFYPPMPLTDGVYTKTVGETLVDLMAANGWEGAFEWAANANEIAPTLVGGSKKHGGADLGPTRARKAWASLGVNGVSLGNTAPPKGYAEMPRLTLRMTARIQGFPDDWQFAGGKTAAYRQIGNAFPPPVANAVALRIKEALTPKTGSKLRVS